VDTGIALAYYHFEDWMLIFRYCSALRCFWYRGYQKVGENITKGKPDMHEAIDVSWNLLCITAAVGFNL
jgi:hypothetical protein